MRRLYFLLALLAAAPATQPAKFHPIQTVPSLMPKAAQHMGRGPWTEAELDAATKWFAADAKNTPVVFGGKLLAPAALDGTAATIKIKARSFKAYGVTWEVTVELASTNPAYFEFAKTIQPNEDLNAKFLVNTGKLAVKPETDGLTVTLDLVGVKDRVNVTVLR